MPNRLNVVGSARDPHVRAVVAGLRGLHGIDCAILEAESGSDLNVQFDQHGRGEIDLGGRLYKVGDPVGSVWWRDKTFVFEISDEASQARWWGWRETTAFYRQVFQLAGSPWISHLDAMRSSESKIVQIATAAAVGFLVPPTLVSNSLGRVRQFEEAERPAIMKPLHTSFVAGCGPAVLAPISLLTNSVSADELAEATQESFGLGPMIFQPEVRKAFEVRTAAFGADAISFKIDSQNSESGSLDWRRASREPIFSPMSTPPEIRARCDQYLAALDIAYGLFDFIVDTHDQWWFLECNPDGQWYWLDPRDDSPLAALFVNGIASSMSRQI